MQARADERLKGLTIGHIFDGTAFVRAWCPVHGDINGLPPADWSYALEKYGRSHRVMDLLPLAMCKDCGNPGAISWRLINWL